MKKIHRFLQSILIVDETNFHLNQLKISIDDCCELFDNLTSLFEAKLTLFSSLSDYQLTSTLLIIFHFKT
jgi:hypothetical protein